MAKDKAAEALRELRRKKVLANLLAGLSYRQIAEACDCSLATVSRDVAVVLGRLKREQEGMGKTYALLELARLNVATNSIWEDIIAGDLGAIDRLLRIQERRAKYLDLDAPLSLKNVTDDELMRQYKELLEQLASTQQEIEALEAEGAEDGDPAPGEGDGSGVPPEELAEPETGPEAGTKGGQT